MSSTTVAIALPIENWQEHGDPVLPPSSEVEYIAPVAVG
jgi:hypothetical protein